MRKPTSGRDLARDILARSRCSVQVGAALEDKVGIFSWGWNSEGTGFGMCAEAHAIHRANKRRLRGSTIFVAGMRRRNGKEVVSKPCEECQKLVKKWDLQVVWRNNNGEWQHGC